MARGSPRAAPEPQADPEPAAYVARNVAAMSLGLEWMDALLSDPAALGVVAASGAYQAAREAMRADGTPAAIDRLSALFQLSPFDEDMLLMALLLQRQGRPKQMTAQLARTLIPEASPEAEAGLWQRLGPQAPLRRFQMIEIAERPLSAATPLYLAERVGRLLVGENATDPQIDGLVGPVLAGSLPRRHLRAVERLADLLAAAPRPQAMIVGPRHSGRMAVAESLARRFALALAEPRVRALEAAPDLLPVLAREAALDGRALVLDIDEPDARRLLRDRLGKFDGMVLAIASARHEDTPEMPVLRLEPLETADRVQLWYDALGPQSGEAEQRIAALAAQFRFGPRSIAAAAAEGVDLWQACRDEAGRRLDALAERIVPRFGWDDIVLPDDVIEDLRAAAAQVRHHTLVYHTHGFAARHPRGRGISVLLSGPSGTGKTMAAEVLAGDLSLDLYRIDLSQVVSKYIGETEKNLRTVFDAAEASGAVLMFDEADALFGKRSEVKDSHDRYANIEVSYLLQRMESYGGLAILATNMKRHIDSAFMRRLKYAIEVPFPDAAARRRIWEKSFPPQLPRGTLDLDALARLEISGGNIAVIAVNAAFLAADEGGPLQMRHLAQAARAEYRKLDRDLRLAWTEAV